MGKVCKLGTVICVTILIAMAIIGISELIQNDPVVQTAQGPVAGKLRRLPSGREIYSFKGIPYAEPPIGELRFQPPVPKKRWTETLEAFSFGNKCIQVGRNGDVIGDENCLFLNIYTPELPTNGMHLLPVMLFVHGGAFLMGTGDDFKPDYVLDKDLILVTCNYRLGALGFLSTGDSIVPGNMALKDLLQALRFIRENIEAFGGDADSITMVGQSAGATLIHLLSISGKAEPLFKRYILQSASALHAWAFHNNSVCAKFAAQLAGKNNCPTNNTKSMIDCLRKISAQQLQSTRIETNSILSSIAIEAWRPTNEPDSEEAIITRPPWVLFKENRAKEKPFIVSFTTNESLHVFSALYVDEELKNNFFRERGATIVEDVISPFESANFSDMSSIVAELKEAYWNNDMQYYTKRFLHGFEKYFSDAHMLFPLYYVICERSWHTTIPFYVMWFDYRGTFSHTSVASKSNENLGSTHSDDLIYLTPCDAHDFGMPSDLRMSEADYEIVDIMVDEWSSFIINGCPLSKNLDVPNMWSTYSDNNSVLRVGNSTKPVVTLDHSFFSDRMKPWEDIGWKYIYPTSSENP